MTLRLPDHWIRDIWLADAGQSYEGRLIRHRDGHGALVSEVCDPIPVAYAPGAGLILTTIAGGVYR
jgi:hypothetical protein